LTAQCTTDHLFAQQLRAEGANSQHVRDGVGIPSFGQHGHRHDAANLLAESIFLAHRVHHFAQERMVGDVVGAQLTSPARLQLDAKLLDLGGRDLAQVVVESLATPGVAAQPLNVFS